MKEYKVFPLITHSEELMNYLIKSKAIDYVHMVFHSMRRMNGVSDALYAKVMRASGEVFTTVLPLY
jgi:hypothetical protein